MIRHVKHHHLAHIEGIRSERQRSVECIAGSMCIVFAALVSPIATVSETGELYPALRFAFGRPLGRDGGRPSLLMRSRICATLNSIKTLIGNPHSCWPCSSSPPVPRKSLAYQILAGIMRDQLLTLRERAVPANPACSKREASNG